MNALAAWFDTAPTPLSGLFLLQRRRAEDPRGFFSKLFAQEELSALNLDIAQINLSRTVAAGSVRGMHFQVPPHPEGKMVSCLRGTVYDVAVDLRQESPTFLKWHGEVLSEDNQKSLFIPKGFAHGFQTLQADCEMLYFHSSTYVPDADGVLNALDPTLGIAWPLPVGQRSARDTAAIFIDTSFVGLNFAR